MTDQGETPSAVPNGPGSGPPVAGIGPLLERFDGAGRLIAAGAAITIVIIVLGIIVGAWSLRGYALVILVAAAVALAVTYLATTTMATDGWPIPGRDIVLAAAALMAILALLNLIEALNDLDQIDDERGGVIGLIVTIALAGAAVVAAIGVLRSPSGNELGPGSMQQRGRGTRIALGGLGLELLAWILMLSISVFALGQTAAFGISLAFLAVIVLVFGSDPSHGWRLPIPAAWIAVALAVLAVLPLIDQTGQYLRVIDRIGLDPIDTLAFLAHAAGTMLVLAGTILSAADERSAATTVADVTTTPGQD